MKPWVKTWGFINYRLLLFSHFYDYAPKLKLARKDAL